MHKMEQLLANSKAMLRQLPPLEKRFLYHNLPWEQRLIGIKGSRGTGKTTLLLQRLAGLPEGKGIYLSLDDLFFSGNNLVSFAEWFQQLGGEYLFVDEVHKYPTWSQELKNIYDRMPELKVVFTGSSIIEMARQEGDLSRRALVYELPGLSFREYLAIQEGIALSTITLDDLLANHEAIAVDLVAQFRPLPLFREYIRQGYYPFVKTDPEHYHQRLQGIVNQILENDIAWADGYDPRQTVKLKQLLYILATNVPFKPNITSLGNKMQVNRRTVINFLHLLEKGRLLHLLYPAGTSVSLLQKPGKVFLNNTNLYYLSGINEPNIGSLRDTFAISQLTVGHRVDEPEEGDFLVDNRYLIEVGGKGKAAGSLQQGYIAADEIEIGVLNKFPLWMLGFLY